MCPKGWHGARGSSGPDGHIKICPSCRIPKRVWFHQNRQERRNNPIDTFAYNERWNSHYCQDCNIWVESGPCEGQGCDERCYYFARPLYPVSHDN